MQQHAKLFKNQKDASSSAGSSIAPTPAGPASPPPETASGTQERDRRGSLGSFLRAAGVSSQEGRLANQSSSSRVRKMSFATAKSVELSGHSAVHIILPSSAAHATSSGALTNLRGCVVDMSVPTATGRPFAGLAVRNVSQSLLVCGNVNGATHVTGVDQSIIVVSTRQFRMHECQDCVVYLHVWSKPIIEDCHGIQFAPLPGGYVRSTTHCASKKDS